LLFFWCVQPLLQFQHAKLKFEQALTSAGDITYSIVRPNAYFKSVSGQLELLQQGASCGGAVVVADETWPLTIRFVCLCVCLGWPFVMFGDGTMCKCNPIAEADLATYMINCIEEPDKWYVPLFTVYLTTMTMLLTIF